MRLDINPVTGGYDTVQDEGTPVTTRTTINFTGAGVTASDSGSVTTVNIPGGAGSGATGIATIDFGAFPGKSDTSLDITGQTSIISGSIVDAWIRPTATSDHTADEHLLETIKVVAGNISAGVGFTIYALNTSQLNEGRDRGVDNVNLCTGRGTRIYGQWTVSWQWS